MSSFLADEESFASICRPIQNLLKSVTSRMLPAGHCMLCVRSTNVLLVLPRCPGNSIWCVPFEQVMSPIKLEICVYTVTILFHGGR